MLIEEEMLLKTESKTSILLLVSMYKAGPLVIFKNSQFLQMIHEFSNNFSPFPFSPINIKFFAFTNEL